MSVRKVDLCGFNTNNLNTISEKFKRDLIKKAHSGDASSRNQMIEANLKLVLSIVQKFSLRDICLEDIFQVGTIGLIKAIDNFDLSHNTKFSTYAVPMIIGEIRRYIRDNSYIRVSRSMREVAYKAIQTKEKIFNDTGIEPGIDEIAKILNVSSEYIAISLESINDPLSLEEPICVGDDDNLCLIDQIQDEGGEDWIDEIFMKQKIKNLTKKEKMVLSMRFISGLTQTSVSEKLRISQAQVSRIEKNAIKKIKS